MPPIKKYTKEDIVNKAYDIIKNEGLGALNARRLAKELGCSVQPIFHNFTSMEDVYKEVYNIIYNKYQEYMLKDADKQKAYKYMGLGYIYFAKDYPEFFKILFMSKTNFNAESFILADSRGNDIIEKGQKLTGFSYEAQKRFHVKVWIFTHGLATLVATNTVKFTKEEIEDLLEKTVREMMIGYKKEEL